MIVIEFKSLQIKNSGILKIEKCPEEAMSQRLNMVSLWLLDFVANKNMPMKILPRRRKGTKA